ncbi:MAG: hypothetical protein ACYS5F_07005 [Planctomycetota bacterium]
MGDFEHYKNQVKKDAQERGWEYEELDGSTRLILNMMNGQWDENDYLVIKPGQAIVPSYDSGIINLKDEDEKT